MFEASTVAHQLREFIVGNFLFGQERTLTEDASFAEEGFIDSTGVLQLVAFLEETYGITVEDEELVPENLDSISRITAYLGRKMDHKAGDTPPDGTKVAGAGEQV